MGLFAVYVGWIYNDFLSLAVNAFGSCYDLVDEKWERRYPTCTYPFGIDPAWRVAGNELQFDNSFKMKLAVIIAVTHMLFGILMKGVNAIYFSSSLDFFCEFVPQFIFLTCTFGYMDFMIIVKWLTVYQPEDAPSIITTMIDMVLNPFGIVIFDSIFLAPLTRLGRWCLITESRTNLSDHCCVLCTGDVVPQTNHP